MIVKELDAFAVGNIGNGETLARARRKAEENLAHYLNRAFRSSPNFLIFNGIRLEKDGDAAQMDHLILYRYGMIIVESKSVASRVRINEHEEWARFWNGNWRGMPSPIKQAERQGKFLRHYLQEYRDYLRPQTHSASAQESLCLVPIDTLTAISDAGIIDRPPHLLLEKVCKADQITDRIQSAYRRRQQTETTLQKFHLGVEPLFTFSAEEQVRIAQLLTAHHRPFVAHSNAKHSPDTLRKPQSAVPIPTALQCRHCSAERVDIVYGRYGYYLKCLTCDGNTPLNRLCQKCGGKEKTRKDGRQFFAECAVCTTSYAFHENAHS